MLTLYIKFMVLIVCSFVSFQVVRSLIANKEATINESFFITPGLEQVVSKSMTLDTRVVDWLRRSGALIKSGRFGRYFHSSLSSGRPCIYYSYCVPECLKPCVH